MHVLIPAAGVGKRMGSDRNKLLLSLQGMPILSWTLQAVSQAESVNWIGIIGQPNDFPDFEMMLNKLQLRQTVQLILGGKTRQESVFNGLQALPASAKNVLIHDGARCLATPALFERCAHHLKSCSGLIAAIPVKDTIKIVDDAGEVQNTPDRSQLWAAQTPQGFNVPLLKQCHARGQAEGWQVTDDAALFEKCGLSVRVVEGEESNLKITTPEDLRLGELILNQR
ncbi:MAG: 2-C-methyl-D-erythritol 4-phosphate cytidylyltransferase [Cyanobacteria bacterium P01_H01_bin.15]